MTTATKVRLRFAKRGDLRLVSHHDLMRCLERMVRRARIPLAMTQGFTARPKIVFALALGLGIEGMREVVDFELSEACETSDLLRRLAAAAPPGFVWIAADALPSNAGAPRALSVEYQVPVPPDRWQSTRSALESLLSSPSRLLTRRRADRDREVTIDLRSFVLDAALNDQGLLNARLKVLPEGSARPEELLESLGLRDILDQGAVLVRTEVEIA